MPDLIVPETIEAGGKLTFEAFCESCGEGICYLVTTGETRRRGLPFIRVTPCTTCTDNAKFDSKLEGRNNGLDEGDAEGHKIGYAEGYADGKANERALWNPC